MRAESSAQPERNKNAIVYEYLAYTCATAGGLLDALAAEEVDAP